MKGTSRLPRILLGIHLGLGPVVGLVASGSLLGFVFADRSLPIWAFLLIALPGLALGIIPSNTTLLAAGAAFGWRGAPLVFATMFLASIPGFLVIRHWLRDELRRRLALHPAANRVMLALEQWQFLSALLLRIAPISTFAWTNAILSVGSLTLPRYLFATALGILPRILLLTWAGDSTNHLFDALRTGHLDAPALAGLALAGASLLGFGLLASKILKSAGSPISSIQQGHQ
jgi:uncharacterized membrane protein YdjX (TVP38/TMEM64 family)